MKTALITTTVNVPRVLALYRKCDPDVMFFVAADEKTPLEAYQFCADIPNCEIYSPDRQRELGYECSALIGWNCVQRRNIALLEAVKWGADVIVTIDDDNFPMSSHYFDRMRLAHGGPVFSGLGIAKGSPWFDSGLLFSQRVRQRGFPFDKATAAPVEPVIERRVGVVAGLCFGDSDVDACWRIAGQPGAWVANELGRTGVLIDPGATHTVFNSQNTGFARELAPAMFMMPGVGRHDDIYASLICQRVMSEHDLHIHFGEPFVIQERNKHNLVDDLRAEIDGMEKVEKIAYFLDHMLLASDSTLNAVRAIYKAFDHAPNSYDLLPKASVEAALAFLDDIEKVM